MSYGYGGGGGRRGRRGGRGHRDGSRERMDRGGGGGVGSRGHSSFDFDQDRGGGGGGQKDRPPPHLRGREIGLWYARYGAVRRKQADRRSRAVVQMDEAREEHITKLLNSVQNDQSGPRRVGRESSTSVSDSWQTAATHSGHCYFDGDLPEEEKYKVEVKSDEEEEDITPGQKKASKRNVSKAAVKDEAPDNWDEEDQDEETKEEKPLRRDKDLEFLFQEVVRDNSKDEYLQRDLHSKKSDSKYKEMLKFREKLPSYGKKEASVNFIQLKANTEHHFYLTLNCFCFVQIIIHLLCFRHSSLPSSSLHSRSSSPHLYPQELVELINSNRVLVVSGETGCGKTTQVTQFILDDHINRGVGSMCRVVCTQPRRISAISVAERVAAERAESVGNGNSCGYQIRLQSRLPRRQGSILYCTTGIILQWLRSDPLLSSISHLVLDEIHERNLQSDVLLIIVKNLLKVRNDLKIILMSATLNAEKFSKYFGVQSTKFHFFVCLFVCSAEVFVLTRIVFCSDNCPMIHIPGLTFPVEEYLLEDIVEMTRYCPQSQDRRSSWKKSFWQGRNSRPEKEEKEREYQESWPCYARTLQGRYSDSTIQALEMLDGDEKIDLELILALIRHIVLNEGEGAILVFLPGWDNISTLNDLLTAQQMFRSDNFVIIPLHSLMPTVNQTQVFKRPPPGVRKIVIATNIAETSITIDDVVYVIDGGKIKETNFDTNNNISTMTAEWVSLANAKQRKGRAGRVQPGKCYHLYNGLRASLLDAYQLPEIMRTPLEELCLQIKILKLGSIGQFLEKALDPPSKKAVALAIKNLTDLNALDHTENLTALGFHLARLPVEPHIGKLILFGALLGCLDPVLTIAASLSFKDPFFIPLGKEKMADMRRRVLSRNSKSDHLTIVNAVTGWEEAKRRGARSEKDYCWDNFLSANTLQMLHNMKGQFAEHLMHTGFVSSSDPKDPTSNINSDNEKLIKAVIVAGLYPKVAMIRPSFSKKRPGVKVYTQADGKVCIHPKSVNAEENDFNYTWLIYHLKMRTSSIFLYDCTEVSPFSLLFFGGDITIQKDEGQETIAVDQWIVFRSPARIAHLVKVCEAPAQISCSALLIFTES
uniref:RNA helicase n=1 Tax=Kryptolebias marmoratus TaxID=37003 RepID=A0A3Q3BAB6_KRYMA